METSGLTVFEQGPTAAELAVGRRAHVQMWAPRAECRLVERKGESGSSPEASDSAHGTIGGEG